MTSLKLIVDAGHASISARKRSRRVILPLFWQAIDANVVCCIALPTPPLMPNAHIIGHPWLPVQSFPSSL